MNYERFPQLYRTVLTEKLIFPPENKLLSIICKYHFRIYGLLFVQTRIIVYMHTGKPAVHIAIVFRLLRDPRTRMYVGVFNNYCKNNNNNTYRLVVIYNKIGLIQMSNADTATEA